jgi:lambda family phage portal protein
MNFINDIKFLGSGLSSIWQKRPSLITKEMQFRELAQQAYKRGKSLSASRTYQNSYYPGAETSRYRSDWLTQLCTSTSLLRQSFKVLAARSEYAFRVNPYMRRAVNILKTFTVGSGIRPFPSVKDKNGNSIESINKQLAANWERINDEIYRIGSQKISALEAQGIEFESMVTLGSWLRQTIKGNKESLLPFALTLVKPTQLDFSHDTYFDDYNKIQYVSNEQTYNILGQKMNSFFEPIGFWLDTENELHSSETMSIHYKTVEIAQYLGIPWTVPSLGSVWDIEQLIEDKMLQSRELSRMGIFIKKKAKKDFDDILEISDDGEESIPFDKAQIYFGDEKPEAIQFDDTLTNTLTPMIKVQLHALAIGIGMSYQLLSSDLENANFASGTLNRLVDSKFFKSLFKHFYKCSCQPLWDKIVEWSVLSGKIDGLSYSDYIKNPWMYKQCYWLPEGDQLGANPLQDAQAKKLLYMSGQITMQQWQAENGKDYKEVLSQRAREKQEIIDAGLDELLPTFSGQNTQNVNSNNSVTQGL